VGGGGIFYLDKKKLSKETFVEFKEGLDNRLDTIIDGHARIHERLDDINDFLRNHRDKK